MSDKYDNAVDWLMENPGNITIAWMNPSTKGGCLFQFVTPDGKQGDIHEWYGCLTQIKAFTGHYRGYTPELTQEIMEDHLIPNSVDSKTTREQLEHLANWQRRIDRELNRT